MSEFKYLEFLKFTQNEISKTFGCPASVFNLGKCPSTLTTHVLFVQKRGRNAP